MIEKQAFKLLIRGSTMQKGLMELVDESVI